MTDVKGPVTAEEVGAKFGAAGEYACGKVWVDAVSTSIAALVAERWAERERLWRAIEAGVSEQRDALNEDNLRLRERESRVQALVDAAEKGLDPEHGFHAGVIRELRAALDGLKEKAND